MASIYAILRSRDIEGIGLHMIFCTLFNWRYLPQGIALHKSLERTTNNDFKLYILCMDAYTANALRSLKLRNVILIRLGDIEDNDLRELKDKRSIGEFCWTCTTPLLLHVQAQHSIDTVVTYVDADLWFNSDPRAVLDEMGEGSIFIHEHDFAPEFENLQVAAGRFNVGLVAFRNNDEGRACLERWKAQCINECIMDPMAGKCGDQNYLDEWPDRYPGLVISVNPGIGLAPWNITKHQISAKGRDGILVDGNPVVFYHFHSLSMLQPRLGFKPVRTAMGYSLNQHIVNLVYAPYVKELWRISRLLDKSGYGISQAVSTLPYVSSRARQQELIFQVGGYSLPIEYNLKVLATLYGIDIKHEML